MDAKTPEGNVPPGFSTQCSSRSHSQGCQQGNMPVMQRDQHGVVHNGFPNNKHLCSRQRKRVHRVFGFLVDQGLSDFQT